MVILSLCYVICCNYDNVCFPKDEEENIRELNTLSQREAFLRLRRPGYQSLHEHKRGAQLFVDRPFPICCEPQYESEATCKTFLMKISFE